MRGYCRLTLMNWQLCTSLAPSHPCYVNTVLPLRSTAVAPAVLTAITSAELLLLLLHCHCIPPDFYWSPLLD